MLVAHFSDLHLLSLRGVRPSAFLGKRLTGGLNLLLNRGGEFPLEVARALVEDLRGQSPDQVIVSGDLSNLAFPAELELAREVLEGLGLDAANVTVVPGNHDYYTRSAAVEDHFGKILAPFLAGDVQPGSGPFPLLRLRGELALVALSSSVPSPALMAWGTLGPRQIALAEELLGRAECRDRFRLVVLHHPPHMQHVKWHNRLTDRQAFVEMIGRAGAELVVHGHLHRPLRLALPGPGGGVPLIGVGSGTWLSPRDVERRAQYNLYEIAGRELVRVRRRRLVAGERRFEEIRS